VPRAVCIISEYAQLPGWQFICRVPEKEVALQSAVLLWFVAMLHCHRWTAINMAILACCCQHHAVNGAAYPS
jgi:hypothetical protein